MELKKDKVKVREEIDRITKEISTTQSYVIPDTKKDIIKNIVSNANAFIENVDIHDRKIRLDGKIKVYSLYLDGDENNSSLENDLEFSENLDLNKDIENEKIFFNTIIMVSKIELKVLNERKIQLEAKCKIEVNILKESEYEYVLEVEDEGSKIEKLESNIKINNLIGSGNTKIALKENAKITDVEKIMNIVKIDYKIENVDYKISYNKVLAKGDVVLEVFYRNEENKISKNKASFPVMGFIDIPNVEDTNICKIEMCLRKAQIDVINDNNISADLEIEANLLIYEQKEISLIEDLYGIKNNYKYSKKQINNSSITEEKLLLKNISEKVLIDNIKNLYDTNVFLRIKEKNKNGEEVKYLADAEVTYIYDTFDSKNILSLKKVFEFDFSLENESYDIDMKIENSNFIVLPDSSIDSKLEINIVKSFTENKSIDIIENIEKDEENSIDTYSLVIYYTQKGDSLWKIAKQFKSTVEQIAKVNNIENLDRIDIGQKLYIPKAV